MVSVDVAFKVDHMEPVKPILFTKISKCLLSYWGVQFLITPEGRNGARGIHTKVHETPGFLWLRPFSSC